MKTAPRLALTLAACGLLVGTAVLAGPPTPPAGPVGPTYKTLTQIEPRTPLSTATTPGDEFSVFQITQPGTYYLTGAGSTFERCTVRACGGSGFDLRAGSIVRECVAANNLGAGFVTAGQCEIIGCTARENASGIFVTGNSVVVRGCTVLKNTVFGIGLDAQASLITGNFCTFNGVTTANGGGICVVSGTDHLIIDNVAISNEVGVRVVPFGGTMVVRNRCGRNRNANFILAGGLADGPIMNTTTIETNTNPDANYTY